MSDRGRHAPGADSACESGDVILLEGIQIPAALGVTAAERRMGRPVELDIAVGRDLRAAGQSDHIRNTIHYQELYDLAAEIAGGREHRLVEALGTRIAEAVLERFDVDWITITVRKPKPIAGVLEHAGIRITRRRDGARGRSATG
jgi:dihydroneopterin aldolase